MLSTSTGISNGFDSSNESESSSRGSSTLGADNTDTLTVYENWINPVDPPSFELPSGVAPLQPHESLETLRLPLTKSESRFLLPGIQDTETDAGLHQELQNEQLGCTPGDSVWRWETIGDALAWVPDLAARSSLPAPSMPHFLFQGPVALPQNASPSPVFPAGTGSDFPYSLPTTYTHASYASSSNAPVMSNTESQLELPQTQASSSTPSERRSGEPLNNQRPAKRRKLQVQPSHPGVIILGAPTVPTLPWPWTMKAPNARLVCLYGPACSTTSHFEATSWDDMWGHLGVSKTNATHGISRSKGKTSQHNSKIQCGWSQCGMMMYPSSLANHINLVHLKAFAVECGYCNKSFTQGRNADEHEKPLKCKAKYAAGLQG